MKRKALVALYLLISIGIGFFAANQVNGMLGISFKEKNLPKIPSTEQILTQQKDTSNSRMLNIRLIDMGGVGIVPDSANWGNSYSHNVNRFEDVILNQAPFIEEKNFDQLKNQWETYIGHMHQFDFTGVVFAGFLEFVLFDKIGQGTDIYPEGNIYRERHKVLRDSFNLLFQSVHTKGLKVYLYTDMVAFTPLLREYFIKTYGKIDVTDKSFWAVYQAGLAELFEKMDIDGVVIRIGEAGTVYNKKDWDYSSELFVKDDKAMQLMLTSFLQTAEQHNKLIIFRTWSVGVGKIGNMHTNVTTYNRILDTINSPNLVVSTKYCNGDFYSYVPLNQTLMQGKHRRIAEFQGRREFETFNTVPVYLAPLHQLALQEFTETNPNFDGAWLWTQEGGPLRAGPLSIYPFYGFNLFTDANVYAMGRLIKNPNENLGTITKDWVRANFGDDSLMVNNITQILLKSHEVTKKGLYIKEFAQWDTRVLGLEPPAMLWIFEWDIVGGSSSIFSNIYFICKNNIQSAVDEGYAAVADVREFKKMVLSAENRVTKNKENYKQLEASIDYQINLFQTLALYRNYILKYYEWLDKGNNSDYTAWQSKLKEFEHQYADHYEKYGQSLDFPAYNFDEALRGIKIAKQTRFVTLASRLMVFLLLITFILGMPVIQRKKKKYPMKELSFILWKSLVNPASEYETRSTKCNPVIGFLWLEILIMGSLLLFSSFVAPVFMIVMQVSLIIYMLSIALLNYKYFKTKSAEYAGILAPVLVVMLVLLSFSAFRSPIFFWEQFWISAAFRQVFLTAFIGLIFWSYFVLFQRQKKLGNLSNWLSLSKLFVIQGIQFLVLGVISHWATLEKSMTIINDELMVLPGGLSRILGITTHLGIPTTIPLYLIYAGIVLFIVGAIGSIRYRVPNRSSQN